MIRHTLPSIVLITVLAIAVCPQQSSLQFISFKQAKPVLDVFATQLPEELKDRRSDQLESFWSAWVARRDKEVRARLDQGEEDSITNLLRFGVTYTEQPRIDWPSLFKYGDSAGVTFWAQTRAEDLIRALSSPGKREHMLAARTFLQEKGFAFNTVGERARLKDYLLANLGRMQKEFVGYQEELKALRAANKLDEARMLELDSHLFANRGISLDTNIRPNFAIEQTLKDLLAKGLLTVGSVRRVAVVGPGLDFVNKEEGVDFYPIQTIQPFAVIDSLLKLKLADASSLKLVTYDISSSVNDHIARARARASKGLPYELQIPWDATKSWSPEFTSYWQTFGLRVGRPGRALPVPRTTPELKMRALNIGTAAVAAVQPVDMNVVFQSHAVPGSEKFDLVIGTNIFVYYGDFEQALALRNLSEMIRPGGFLLSNNFLKIFPGSLWQDAGRTTAPISKAEAETIFYYRRER